MNSLELYLEEVGGCWSVGRGPSSTPSFSLSSIYRGWTKEMPAFPAPLAARGAHMTPSWPVRCKGRSPGKEVSPFIGRLISFPLFLPLPHLLWLFIYTYIKNHVFILIVLIPVQYHRVHFGPVPLFICKFSLSNQWDIRLSFSVIHCLFSPITHT